MKRSIAPLLAAYAALTAGCAPISGKPAGEAFAVEHLKMVKSAAHWDVIAADVATQTADQAAGLRLLERPLFVPEIGSSAFAKSFREMLVTQLVNRGLAVSDRAAGALELRYGVQLVRQPQEKIRYPGPLTRIAADILVLHLMDTSSLYWGIAGLAAADAADAHLASRASLNSEIVVTASIADGARYLMRRTDVYYVADGAAAHYRATDPGSAKRLEVSDK